MELNRKEIHFRLNKTGKTLNEVARIAKVDPSFVTNMIAGKRNSQRVLDVLRLYMGEPALTIKQKKQVK